MNTIKFIIATLPFILILPNSGFSQKTLQEGFIVKNSGDTIQGYIQNKNEKALLNKCYFKQDIQNEMQVFSPDDLVGFGFKNGRAFVSNKLFLNVQDSLSFFAEKYIGDDLSLFIYNKKYFVKDSSRSYLLVNTRTSYSQNDKVLTRNNYEYIGILNMLMKDCPDLSKIIQTTKLQPISLEKTIEYYYSCKKEKPNLYYNPSKAVAHKIGIGLSLVQAEIKVHSQEGTVSQSIDDISFERVSCLSPRIFYNTQIPGISNRISFQVNLSYAQFQFKGTGLEDTPYYIHTASVSFNTLDLSIMAKYGYPIGHFRINTELGIQESKTGNYRLMDLMRFYTSSGTIFKETYNNELVLNSNEFGFLYGLGLEYNVGKSNAIFFELLGNSIIDIAPSQIYKSSGREFIYFFGISHTLNKS